MVYYNKKFINDYFAQNNNFTTTEQLNRIGFTNIYSNIAIISFAIFLIVSFLSIKKITSVYSEKIKIISLLLFEMCLAFLTIRFGTYSSKYQSYSSFYQHEDIYGIVANLNKNISSLFTSLSIVSLLAFLISLFLIMIELYIFSDKLQQTSGNIPLDYGYDIFNQGIIRENNSSDRIKPPNTQSTNLMVSCNCPKCGSSINIPDKYCQNCGTRI